MFTLIIYGEIKKTHLLWYVKCVWHVINSQSNQIYKLSHEIMHVFCFTLTNVMCLFSDTSEYDHKLKI